MALDTTCPVCTAPHARKLSLVYEEGLSSAIVTTQSVGKANTIGAHKITTTGTSTQVQQTQLSQSAAPPPPVAALVSAGARARGNAILVAFVLALLVAFANGKGFLHGLLFFVMTFIVGIVLSVVIFKETATAEEIEEHEKATTPQRNAIEEWNRTFACMACGHRFTPSEETTGQVA